MTDDTTNLVLEHLRHIRAKVDHTAEDVHALKVQMALMGQQLGALTSAVYSGRSEIESLAARVARLEQRLELADH